jgi:hypothetical protein
VASLQYPEYYYHYEYQEVSEEKSLPSDPVESQGLKQSWPLAQPPHWQPPSHHHHGHGEREESFIQVPQGFIAILIPSAGGGWHHHHENAVVAADEAVGGPGCRKRRSGKASRSFPSTE